jgi:hypothetical protein
MMSTTDEMMMKGIRNANATSLWIMGFSQWACARSQLVSS